MHSRGTRGTDSLGLAESECRIRRACAEIRRDNARALKQNLVAALPKALFVSLLGWTLPVYTVPALRRVFKNGWLATLLRALALAVGYFLLAFVTWFAALVYAALEL